MYSSRASEKHTLVVTVSNESANCIKTMPIKKGKKKHDEPRGRVRVAGLEGLVVSNDLSSREKIIIILSELGNRNTRQAVNFKVLSIFNSVKLVCDFYDVRIIRRF